MFKEDLEVNLKSVLLCIDHFGSGGAQRQIVLIANGLSQRGIDVHLVNYYPHLDHYRSNIHSGVHIHDFSKTDKVGLSVIIKLRKFLKNKDFKSALVFLDTPAFYLEIANLLLGNKVNIIYSERSSLKLRPNGLFPFLKRNLHRFCSHITSNSISQTNILKRMYKNVSYIPNIIPDEVLDEAIDTKSKFNSRNVVDGGMFVAQKGTVTDGHKYIKSAVDLGAKVVVCEDLPEDRNDKVTYVVVNNADSALATMASNFYDNQR